MFGLQALVALRIRSGLTMLALAALSIEAAAQAKPDDMRPIGTVTLTQGAYPEIFENDTLRWVGNALFNTQLGKVVAIRDRDAVYRFGFQGQEKDDEIHGATGTSYAFEYRMHDARVGRFLSIDPLAAKYPHNSPYAFSENRIIDGVDFEGSEYLDYMELINHRTPGDMTKVGVIGHNAIRKTINTGIGAWNLAAGLWTGDVKMTPGVWQYQLDDAVSDAVSETVDGILDPQTDDIENFLSAGISFGTAKVLAPLTKMPLQKVSAPERATQIHNTLKPAAASRMTTAVVTTEEGIRVVSSSELRLRPAQRAVLGPGEVEGIGAGHAEITGVNAAKSMGLTPTGVAASRPICAGCASSLEELSIQLLSPRK